MQPGMQIYAGSVEVKSHCFAFIHDMGSLWIGKVERTGGGVQGRERVTEFPCTPIREGSTTRARSHKMYI